MKHDTETETETESNEDVDYEARYREWRAHAQVLGTSLQRVLEAYRDLQGEVARAMKSGQKDVRHLNANVLTSDLQDAFNALNINQEG